MDLDEGEEDGGGKSDSDGGYSGRACQLGPGYDSDSNVDMDHVSAVNGSRCFLFFSAFCSCSLSMSCSIYHFVLIDRAEFVLTFAQLFQGVAEVSQRDGMRMPKVRLDIFHALQRISRLVKKNHGAFKPFMARLRDACFIVNSEDIKEASFVDITRDVDQINDMKRLDMSRDGSDLVMDRLQHAHFNFAFKCR